MKWFELELLHLNWRARPERAVDDISVAYINDPKGQIAVIAVFTHLVLFERSTEMGGYSVFDSAII